MLQGLRSTPMLCTLQEALGHLDYLCNRLLDIRLSHVEMQPGWVSVLAGEDSPATIKPH